jgi:folate-dependent tRNA-U54 methylase TrmFO/GidA
VVAVLIPLIFEFQVRQFPLVESQVAQRGEQTIHAPLTVSAARPLVYVPAEHAEYAVWKMQRVNKANNIFCIVGFKLIFIA